MVSPIPGIRESPHRAHYRAHSGPPILELNKNINNDFKIGEKSPSDSPHFEIGAIEHEQKNSKEDLSKKRALEVIECYKQNFQKLYLTAPTSDQVKDLRIAKSIISRCGGDIDKVKRAVAKYFTLKERYYLSRGHPIECISADLNKFLALAAYEEKNPW